MSTCIRRNCTEPATNSLLCLDHQPAALCEEEMVRAASVPSAADLLQKAMQAGLIDPSTAYVTVTLNI